MKNIVIFLWVIGAFVVSLPAAPPNILLIVSEDNGPELGCYGDPYARTPHLDKLASQGVRFDRAFVAQAGCSQSRASLLTGLYPHQHGQIGLATWGFRMYRDDTPNIPRSLKAAGYRTGILGKLHVNPESAFPFDFHEITGGNFARKQLADFARKQLADYARHAASFITAGDQPFFLSVNFPDAHDPWLRQVGGLPKTPQTGTDVKAMPYMGIDPPEMREMVADYYNCLSRLDTLVGDLLAVLEKSGKADDCDDLPVAGKQMAADRRGDFELVMKEGRHRESVQAYLASITYGDALIGRLLDALDASPAAKNTIVVLWSDHGWHLGEKQHLHKFTLWERSTRVPFIIAAPGITTANARTSRAVGLIDLFPTLNELCALPAINALDGMSLVRLLKDPSHAWDKPALTTHGQGNHALRTERWRFIRYADGGEELYDHTNDPNEWTNLAGRPEFVSVKADLAKWLPKTDAPNLSAKARRSKKNKKIE